MTSTRVIVLTLGPILMVTISFVIAAPARPHTMPSEKASVEADSPIDGRPMSEQCHSTAAELISLLPPEWCVLTREPFILSGDLRESDIDSSYQETIFPTVRALQHQYFQSPISHPIVIILCSSDAEFRRCNMRLDQNERNEYSGIYSRRHRRVVVNISSGDGTLAHELTHALAHADFPKMPEWFDEGLASLHEECEFTPDGLSLIGLDNWRIQAARDAMERGELRLIQDVSSKRFATRDRAHVDYAYARSLCLYLQEHKQLEMFYRTYRQSAQSDPTGLRTLCLVTNVSEPQELDDSLRNWLIERTSRTP